MAKKTKGTLWIHILMDASGSMQPHQNTAVNSINSYVCELVGADLGGFEPRVNVVMFDDPHNINPFISRATETPYLSQDRFRWIRKGATVEEAILHQEEFTPRGWTPLFDAVADSFFGLLEQVNPNTDRVMWVIFTDGEENRSREWKDGVKSLMDRAANQLKWGVVYLGAGHDSWRQASQMGLNKARTMDLSMANMGDTYRGLAVNTVSYANAATASADKADFTDEQRADAVK